MDNGDFVIVTNINKMKFAIIGNPIDKSLSPQLHEILYEKLNILNCSFEKIHIENDKLDDFFNDDFSNGDFDMMLGRGGKLDVQSSRCDSNGRTLRSY